MREAVSEVCLITKETPKIGEETIKFPLRLKGLGRYIVDSTNTIIGRYYKGDSTIILDAMNKHNSLYPIGEGIELGSRTDNDWGTTNNYYAGDEVMSIKVEKGKREK